ncbi:Crp/Fnr family transcriptional regulator [Litoreibacter arenae]|uniref:cAMP-binding protein n=1 Tax=Litoreibacter arenae DSM 19593 TaxID=1123360 RepID=S9QA27_9RHOB|nr:Crp/Fnr family transcriptional regulator [Litoreibacter arenae]EPX78221.1 cAMP-binding protein [Litoreibacter arenae DSM 19593]
MSTSSAVVPMSFGFIDHALVEEYLNLQPPAAIIAESKGKMIVQEGDFVDHSMLLLEGWIGLSKMLPDGETQIIDILLPGDFALVGAHYANKAACSIEALSDVRFINIRPHHANGPSKVMQHVREMMAAEIVTTQARTAELMLRIGKGNAANRIAYALLEFFVRLEDVGRTQDRSYVFPITQQKFGEFTGLSNVHVCRTLRRLERDGIISHPTPTRIELTDMDALCDIAEIDLESFREEIIIRRRK